MLNSILTWWNIEEMKCGGKTLIPLYSRTDRVTAETLHGNPRCFASLSLTVHAKNRKKKESGLEVHLITMAFIGMPFHESRVTGII